MRLSRPIRTVSISPALISANIDVLPIDSCRAAASTERRTRAVVGGGLWSMAMISVPIRVVSPWWQCGGWSRVGAWVPPGWGWGVGAPELTEERKRCPDLRFWALYFFRGYGRSPGGVLLPYGPEEMSGGFALVRALFRSSV